MLKSESIPFSLKKTIILSGILLIALTTGFVVFSGELKCVKVTIDSERTIDIKTTKNTVGQVLEENNLIYTQEEVDLPFDTVLTSKNTIIICKKKEDKVEAVLSANVEGNEENGDLEEGAIVPNDETGTEVGSIHAASRFEVDVKDIIAKNQIVTEKLETLTEPIPFETETKNSKLTSNYTTKVVTEGKDGLKKVTYKVRYEDEKEIARVEVDSEVIKEPVTKVVERVAKTNPSVSRGGYVARTGDKPENFIEVKEMKATAYCLCSKCCGKSPSSPGYGVTSSGLKIVPDTGMKVIAVDPKVIPLGTWVYVEGLNGASDYGYAIAADTGGAIKNNKIDLYMETHDATRQWGIKSVKVYIVE